MLNLIRVTLLIAAAHYVSAAEASDKKHPIYSQIVKNKPRIDKSFAMKLSNIIFKMTRKHKVPANIYTAILMQESGYKLSAKGCHKGIQQPSKKYMDTAKKVCQYYDKSVPRSNVYGCMRVNFPQTNGLEVKVCSDFGMSQIYYKTARGFKFDIDRLTTDLEYSIEAGAIVLADFKKRYSHREIDWWTRYNASSRSKRNIYKTLVERYL